MLATTHGSDQSEDRCFDHRVIIRVVCEQFGVHWQTIRVRQNSKCLFLARHRPARTRE